MFARPVERNVERNRTRKIAPRKRNTEEKGGRTYYENGIFLGPVRGIRAAFNSAFTLASSGRVREAGGRLRKIFESPETFPGSEIHVKSLRDCIRTRAHIHARDARFLRGKNRVRWTVSFFFLFFSSSCLSLIDPRAEFVLFYSLYGW